LIIKIAGKLVFVGSGQYNIVIGAIKTFGCGKIRTFAMDPMSLGGIWRHTLQ
jgi:hypothetical protein